MARKNAVMEYGPKTKAQTFELLRKKVADIQAGKPKEPLVNQSQLEKLINILGELEQTDKFQNTSSESLFLRDLNDRLADRNLNFTVTEFRRACAIRSEEILQTAGK